MNDTFLCFDLDGMISDPLDGFAWSLNYGLSFYGHEEISISHIVQYVGPPLDDSFKTFTGITDNIEITAFRYQPSFQMRQWWGNWNTKVAVN